MVNRGKKELQSPRKIQPKPKIRVKVKKVLVVLCGGMTDNGYVNERSKIRCDAAVTIQHKFDLILTTTGRTYRKSADSISEARCLANYMVSCGVAPSKLLCEEFSKDTFSNAFYSRLMLDNLGISHITVLTNRFHMKRSRLLFRFVFGIGAVEGVSSRYKLAFIACDNPVFSEAQLQNHLAHEEIICAFYRKHLKKTYGLVPGDITKLKWFMEQVNPAMCAKTDMYHEQLTVALHARVEESKSGY